VNPLTDTCPPFDFLDGGLSPLPLATVCCSSSGGSAPYVCSSGAYLEPIREVWSTHSCHTSSSNRQLMGIEVEKERTLQDEVRVCGRHFCWELEAVIEVGGVNLSKSYLVIISSQHNPNQLLMFSGMHVPKASPCWGQHKVSHPVQGRACTIAMRRVYRWPCQSVCFVHCLSFIRFGFTLMISVHRGILTKEPILLLIIN